MKLSSSMSLNHGKTMFEGGQVQGWGWFPHSAGASSALWAYQQSHTTHSKQIRSIPQ